MVFAASRLFVSTQELCSGLSLQLCFYLNVEALRFSVFGLCNGHDRNRVFDAFFVTQTQAIRLKLINQSKDDRHKHFRHSDQ